MKILSFIKLFTGYTFQLVFNHLNQDGSLVYDKEYSYWGLSNEFETRMKEYSWLFDIEISDTSVTAITLDKRARICAIYIESGR